MDRDDPREPVDGASQEEVLEQDTGDGELPPADQDEGADSASDQETQDQPPDRSDRVERRQDSLRDLIEENRRSREALEQERQALNAERTRYSQPDPRVEQERIAQMDPEARIKYEYQRDLAQVRNESLASQFRNESRIDKMAFDSQLSNKPVLRKYEEEVERRYRTQYDHAYRQGRPDYIVNREMFLRQVIGDDVLKNGDKALKTARETGQRNIQRQTTRTGNIAGNVRPSKSDLSPAEKSLAKMRAAGVLEE